MQHLHQWKRRGCQNVSLCPSTHWSWSRPWRKDTWNHVYLLLTCVPFPSSFPLAPTDIQAWHMEGESISTSTFLSVSLHRAAWTPSRMLLLFAAPGESGSAQKGQDLKKMSSLSVMALLLMEGVKLVCPVLLGSMQHGSDGPWFHF